MSVDIFKDLKIDPDQSLELLKELHILTRDGKINQDSRRKLKQVNHLFQFIRPYLKSMHERGDKITLVDHGAGKSYLGFIINDMYLKNIDSHVYGIETRQELVDKSQLLAQKSKFKNMSFLNLSVQQSMTSHELPAEVKVVTALHACDTATDDAIHFALKKRAQLIVLVPCCQAEVASVLRTHKSKQIGFNPLVEIWRHSLHTREFGSHLTNVLRCLELEASGYQVTVTELIGWEHSMKNELIIAEYIGQPNLKSKERLTKILEQMGISELAHRFHLS
jgi:hypothetical protein